MYETEKRLLGHLCLILRNYHLENDGDIFRHHSECSHILKSMACIESILKIVPKPRICVYNLGVVITISISWILPEWRKLQPR